MNLKEIERHIKDALPDAKIEIQDLAGNFDLFKSIISQLGNDAFLNLFCIFEILYFFDFTFSNVSIDGIAVTKFIGIL